MSELPNGLIEFLERSGWGGAAIDPIPGDASFRRYFRIITGGRNALLMHAPPPEEDVGPFVAVARYLLTQGHRAPEIYAMDDDAGWLLIEDFGRDRMRDWLDDNPLGEDLAYARAIDTLAELHRRPPGEFGAYDMATYQREAALFAEWYCPAMKLDIDVKGFVAAWEQVLKSVILRQEPGVTVLRDYHAENIMLLNPASDGTGAQGLIDFQDALVGHPAYDLVSLLQDARRDVSLELEARMLDRYCAKARPGAEFAADYARLGAQRNTKIIGIFTRLHKRDGKAHYLDFIPRVWTTLERDLSHIALEPVRQWFDANIPQDLRDAKGGRPQ